MPGLTGAVPPPLRLARPDGTTRPVDAEPHFAFSPTGDSLFALQSEPPAVRVVDLTAGAGPRLIGLPSSARDGTLTNWPVWESARHLLLPLPGTTDALRVDTRTGEHHLAAVPAGVLVHPMIRT